LAELKAKISKLWKNNATWLIVDLFKACLVQLMRRGGKRRGGIFNKGRDF
jgi:hypothetical protein